MLIDHWAVARQIQEDTGLSAAELAALPIDEYARLSGRQTPAEAAVAALDARYDVGHPQPVQEPQSAPQGVTDEQFHLWRQNRARGGEGRGIFDSVGSQSDEYSAAVRQQAGRGALSSANVQEPPRIGRVFIEHTQPEGRQSLYQGQ